MYFTLAANVGSMFLASGAAVKCVLYCVNVLEAVFETGPTTEKHREWRGKRGGGLNVLANAHTQYVHMNVHTQTDTNACVYCNHNFFGNHKNPSVMIERSVSAIRYTHTAVSTFIHWLCFHWPL